MRLHNHTLRIVCLLPVVSLLVGLASAGVGFAQQPAEPPLVAFVVDSGLGTSSNSDVGPDGLVKLNDIFSDLGARTTTISLEGEISPEVSVVVIVGPRRGMSTDYLARLWVHIARGGHVLIALDPLRHAGRTADRARDGLPQLLDLDYGIGVQDAFIAEPWFTRDTFSELQTSYSLSYPDVLPHPVIAPLVRYDVPVQVWGARPVNVEPFGLDSTATPLLATRSAHGETGPVLENRDPQEPVRLDLDQDLVGLLDIAALAENARTGSRVAFFGDSEIFMNDFGLNYFPNSLNPLYPGDWLVAERTAAWLLGLPEGEWPDLPGGYSWIAIDGQADDWPANVQAAAATGGESSAAGYDIQQTRAFRDADYLYVLVETGGTPGMGTTLLLDIDRDNNGEVDTQIVAGTDQVQMGAGDTIPDARLAVGSALELRLPLRVAGATGPVTSLCLSADEGATTRACLGGNLPISTLNTQAPSDVRDLSGPYVTVETTSRVNLRGGPGTGFPIEAIYANGQLLLATGRNEAGDWIKVEGASASGWMATFLIYANHDIMALPVVEP